MMKTLEIQEKEGYLEVKSGEITIQARVQYTPPSEEIINEISESANLVEYSFENGDVLAYKGVVYTKNALSGPKLVHELTHLIQQSKWPNLQLFVQNYTQVTKFRLGIELEAYRAEYQEAKDRLMGGDIEKYLWQMASDLAGRYRLDINRLQAYQLIKNK